jgi:hypothetical protein
MTSNDEYGSWTRACFEEENDTMRIVLRDLLAEGNMQKPSPQFGAWRKVARLATGMLFCASLAGWAQTPDPQGGDQNKSWKATTESEDSGNTNPTRTIESHTQNGNRTLDKQSVQRRGPNGNFEPFQDIEKESVQVNATTVRTVVRTFATDGKGQKTLVQMTEEEKRTPPGGKATVERTTSNPDLNGRFQVVRREIQDTKKTSPDVEETKTTVFLPGGNGGLAPAIEVQESRKQSGDHTVEFQKSTLFPDGNGNWQVGEARQGTIKEDGKNRVSEEHVSRPGSDGKLAEVSRTVAKEAESASGEKRNTIETFSTDVPGSAPDGKLHLVERVTTAGRTGSSGQITEQQVENVNPGDPGAGLRVTAATTDTVRAGASGTQATRTIRIRDANGSLGVVAVDTTKSDNVHAVQVDIAPSNKPK